MKNEHSQSIPAEVLQEAQTKLDELIVLVAPYIVSLTPEERHGMPKMGEKTISFVEKAYNFAVQNPALCPPYLDIAAFGIDFQGARVLLTLLNTAQQFYQNLDDTEMVAGSEAYQAALVFYNSVKTAAAQNVPGAKAVYEELRSRFPGGKRKISESNE